MDETRGRAGEAGLWTTCWFCGAPAADSTRNFGEAYPVTLYSAVDVDKLSRRTKRVTWKTVKIHVPRCGACKKSYDDGDVRFRWFAIAGIIALVAAIASIWTPAGWIGLIVGLLVTVSLYAIGWRIGKAPGQSIARLHSFPAVADKLRTGWKEGDKPPAAYG
jgi:hypothetical protein